MLPKEKTWPPGVDPVEIKNNFDKLAGDNWLAVNEAQNFFVKAKDFVEVLIVRWWLYTDFVAGKEKAVHSRIKKIFALRKSE